jgi:hypothetical protein
MVDPMPDGNPVPRPEKRYQSVMQFAQNAVHLKGHCLQSKFVSIAWTTNVGYNTAERMIKVTMSMTPSGPPTTTPGRIQREGATLI